MTSTSPYNTNVPVASVQGPSFWTTLGHFVSTIFWTRPVIDPELFQTAIQQQQSSSEPCSLSDSLKLQQFASLAAPIQTSTSGHELLAEMKRGHKPSPEILLQTIIHEAKKPQRLDCIEKLLKKAHGNEYKEVFPDIFFSLLTLYSHCNQEREKAEQLGLALLESGMSREAYRDLGTPLEAACMLKYPKIAQKLLKEAPKNLKDNEEVLESYRKAAFTVYNHYRLDPNDSSMYDITDAFGQLFSKRQIAPHRTRIHPTIAFRGGLKALGYDFEKNIDLPEGYDKFFRDLCHNNDSFSQVMRHRTGCSNSVSLEVEQPRGWVSNAMRTFVWIEDLLCSRKELCKKQCPTKREYDFGTLTEHPTLKGPATKNRKGPEILAGVKTQLQSSLPDEAYLFSIFVDFITPAPKPQWKLANQFLELLSEKGESYNQLKADMYCSCLSLFAANDEEGDTAEAFAKKLIDSGFDLNERIPSIKATPLHAAIYLEFWDVAERLVEKKVDLCKVDANDLSPISLLNCYIKEEENSRTKRRLQRLATKMGELCKEHERYRDEKLHKMGSAAFNKAVECEEKRQRRHRPIVKQPRRSTSGLELRLPGEASPEPEYRCLQSSSREQVEIPDALVQFPQWVKKQYDLGTLRRHTTAASRPRAVEVFQ